MATRGIGLFVDRIRATGLLRIEGRGGIGRPGVRQGGLTSIDVFIAIRGTRIEAFKGNR